ncbi:hypothetical protein ASE67_04955 [Sphingomonas sp. Leaf23]|uniref:hypothetical protein n=1 Tax=Sphingomonas sp. Leaf23 TaxID=1735689 RepID=UPI0006FAE355|nr:hypothetical protein [Sphingomonas sp. Leaf23]KQM87095.1 hypothetical protein ASE67_04955 [Sphingomonas sp. Leaf23]
MLFAPSLAPRPHRHRIVRDGEGERIVIPARRNWFVLLFTSFWLCGWSIGGVAVIGIFVTTGDPFLAVWLIAWAAGWFAALVTVLWQAIGHEVIALRQGDLFVERRAGPFRRTLRFPVTHLARLRVAPRGFFDGMRNNFPPFFDRSGLLRFDLGARTVRFGGGVDQAEAAILLGWLLARLQRSAASID